jgi:hypothetical protein
MNNRTLMKRCCRGDRLFISARNYYCGLTKPFAYLPYGNDSDRFVEINFNKNKSKVLYRPHRGSLDESMALVREFNNTEDMILAVRGDWDKYLDGQVECTIDPNSINDDRIGWHNTHYVLIDGMCVGMCNLEE